jgi:phosphoribosyl 1,2-cyclic phosphate phosphodiesterase
LTFRPVAARVTMLGTGTSHGVPMIGCGCATCRSTDPRDRRMRPSIYVDIPDRARILVDTSTDLRQQVLAHGITRVDAILFTHAHADHILGLDDVRAFNELQGTSIACYANAEAWVALRKTFFYLFDGIVRQGGGVAQLDPHEIDGPFTIDGVGITPVPLWHGKLPILGYRIGNFSYLTDCNAIPEASWRLIEGTDVLVIDALRDSPHDTHFTIAQALRVVERVAPRRAYFTHMTHDVPHAATSARLPAGVELAYDGLVLDIEAAAP